MPKKEKKRENEEDDDEEEDMTGEEVKDEKKKVKKEKKPPPGPPKKTALGDTATIKRMLDDTAIKVMLEMGSSGNYKYEEDTALSNLKLVIGFSGVGASLASHVYPATFPKNWWVLLICCALYFIASGILQLLLSFVELESILLVRRAKKGSGGGLNLSSHFPRFQEIYTLGITPLPKGSMGLWLAPKFKPLAPDEAPSVGAELSEQKSWPVNHFFDEEGTYVEEKFEQAVQDFFAEYEAKNGTKKTN